MKKYLIGIAISLVFPAFVFAYFQPATLTNGVDRVVVKTQEMAQKYFALGYELEKKIGASGSTFFTRQYFNDGANISATGGGVYNASTTLTVAKTLTASQVCNNSVITVNSAAVAGTLSAASLDITMPATSTLFRDCLKKQGDSRKILFVNASPTAASTTEIVAGTGCLAMISGDTGAADTIAGSAAAWITFTRVTDWLGAGTNYDCLMTVEELISH